MIALGDVGWAEKRGAVIDGAYRYWWHRKFEDGNGVTVFGMLNPSKADSERNDPTSRRCVDFAQTWNTRAVVLVNLYAAIATEPDEMYEMDDAVGKMNWQYIDLACKLVKKEGGQFVVAWGGHPLAKLRSSAMLSRLQSAGVIPMHMGLIQNGAPRHPLYTPANVELETYGW